MLRQRRPRSAGPGRTLPNMSAFVGRAEELERLEAAGRAAVAGDVVAVLVVGEPGAGKSRLLAEAAKRIPWAVPGRGVRAGAAGALCRCG